MMDKKRLVSYFKSERFIAFSLFLLLFAVAALYIFQPVLSWGVVTVSPDAPKVFSGFNLVHYLEALLGGSLDFQPGQLREFFFHPLVWQELQYAVPCLMAAIGLAFYLRTQGVGRTAAYGGGLFFAFCGYSFTLVNAGHRGYFSILAYFLFTFWLMDRCFVKRRWLHFALLGAFAMWAEMQQPDIWMLFFALLVFYGIWRLLRLWLAERNVSFLWKLCPRFLVTAAVMLLVGSSAIRAALTETLAGRKAQIEASASVPTTDGNDAEQNAAEAHRQWIFTTNWSMPPEDFCEMLVPGIFGDDSGRPPYPYWGRLGRVEDSQFVKGRTRPNFRQHTLYIGLTAVLFALFGIFSACRRCRSDQELPPGEAPRPNYADVPFWALTAVLCAVFAMGRYTPVYKLVYQLPFVDYLRAPVKFYHLVELAVACLAGFGLQAFLDESGAGRRGRRAWTFVCLGATIALFIGLRVCTAKWENFAGHIELLGLRGFGKTLAGYMQTNLKQAMLLAAALTGAFAFAGFYKKAGKRTLVTLATLLIVVGVCDMARVCRRFIVPVDVTAYNTTNPLIEKLSELTGNRAALIANYATHPQGPQFWLNDVMARYGYESALPYDRRSEWLPLYLEYGARPISYLQKSGAQFTLLTREKVAEFDASGILEPVMDMTIDGNGIHRCEPNQDSIALCRIKLHSDPPMLLAERTRPQSLSTKGVAELAEDGLVQTQDRFEPGLVAFVDGKPAELVEAAGKRVAVRVPKGKHTVEVRHVYSMRGIWGVLCFLALTIWTFIDHLLCRKALS